MRDPLASPRLSIEHAKSHVDEIEILAKAFFESKPYAVFTEPDPLYATHNLQYARLVKALPLRIPGLALDAVKNIRSALDQLGYAVGAVIESSN